ncbi:MAG: insulinase family protein [Alphaproteobacteria bacterium]|nr:insulinase family protein [Alphaproteobacteria bacterium]
MKKLIALFLCCFILPFEAVGAPTTASGVVVRKKIVKKETKPKSVLPPVTPMPFHTPEVRKVVTDSGIEAWLIEEKSTPVIAVSLIFKGGKASDPKRLSGLSSLAMSLMDEGAGRYNAEAFSEILSEKAINISFSAFTDTLSANLETLREHKEEAFDLFRLTLTSPRFDRKNVQRIKEQMYAVIDARKGDPNAVAFERWAKLVYKDHAYGRTQPTKKSIRAITRANLRSLVRDRLAKDNLIIGVAGNISAEELKPLLEKTFADLPEKSYVKQAPAITPELSNRTDVLSMDVPQSAVLFGHKGIARDDPDFYAALLVNYSFGGGSFASRLFKEVREKNGLAYSIDTFLNTNRLSPMIMGSVGSDNAKLADAIKIIQQQWRLMAEEGPAEQELNDAKTFITGSFPLAFSSSKGLASFLAGMQYYDLGIDYLKRHDDLINSVTLEQAKKTAARLLLPDSLFFVVVGKPANL